MNYTYEQALEDARFFEPKSRIIVPIYLVPNNYPFPEAAKILDF